MKSLQAEESSLALPLHFASTLCHLETIDQHQFRYLLSDKGCEHHNFVLTDLPKLSLVPNFFPWGGQHQVRLAIFAHLCSLEYFLGHEYVCIVVFFLFLNEEFDR